jgi:septal ring factor EnvC (AmiA/AmiB activator)
MKPIHALSHAERAQVYHATLHKKIEDLGSTVEGVISSHEKDYMRAFQGQLFQVQKQMQHYKNYSSIEQERKKRDKEINDLAESLDWHKQEAKRLEETLVYCRKELAKWKSKAQAAEADCSFFQDQLKIAKREADMLRQRLETPCMSPQPPPKPAVFKRVHEPPVRADKTKVIVQHYQKALSQERRKMKKLNALTSQTLEQRSDLEDVFLECVTEVRKTIGRRSPQGGHMTATDKRQILELLVSNDRVLTLVYESLFPNKRPEFSFSAASPEYDESITSTPKVQYRKQTALVVGGKLTMSMG